MSSIQQQIDAYELEARAQWEAYVHSDFDPTVIRKHTARSEDRMVAAVEYAAYQLGQINRKLDWFRQIVEREAQR